MSGTKKFTPKIHQAAALNDILNHEHGLLHSDRVQYISACGTGKTPVLLWSVEEYLKSANNGKIEDSISVFLFPSLTLINQSYDSYKTQNSIPDYKPMVVCSDDKVGAKEDEEDTPENCKFAVSTEQAEIERYLRENTLSNKVIFSTYKSSHLVGEALKSVGKVADITVYDEAHRTAIKNENSERIGKVLHNSGWSLDDSNFPSKKRLFATATPRHYNLSENFYEMGLIDKGNVAYSMDNPRLFGKIAHEYSMRDAIEDGVITDYKILAITVTGNEVQKFLNPTVNKDGIKHFSQDVMESAAKILAISSASEKYGLKNALVFNSSIPDSLEFERNFKTYYKDFDFNIEHIDGTMNNVTREEKIKILEKDGFSILTNAKLMGEGHDIPKLDFVVFNNVIKSVIDSVQRTGRVQRKDKDNPEKVGYILLPIFVNDVNQDIEEALHSNSGLQTLFNTVNSLKESDTQLRDWIGTRKKIREERKDSGKALFSSDDKIVFTSSYQLQAEIAEAREIRRQNESFGSDDEDRITFEKKGGVKNDTARVSSEHRASEKDIDLKYQEMIEKWEDKVEATLVGERWQLEAAWDNNLALLYKHRETGEVLTVETVFEGENIGSWAISSQRKTFKNGTLSPDRVAKLLEFDKDFFKSHQEIDNETWDNNLALLYRHRETGEVLAVKTVFEGENIGSWAIKSQKRTFKNGALSADKVAKLLEFDKDFFKSQKKNCGNDCDNKVVSAIAALADSAPVVSCDELAAAVREMADGGLESSCEVSL